jgi:hypothetical protein
LTGPVRPGQVSSLGLLLSGVAGVLIPERVGTALELNATSSRAVAETRAGLGATYAALGGWALVSEEPAADVAVGVTWLGAAVVRLAALRIDRPRTTWTYWAFLAAELGFGAVALASARKR